MYFLSWCIWALTVIIAQNNDELDKNTSVQVESCAIGLTELSTNSVDLVHAHELTIPQNRALHKDNLFEYFRKDDKFECPFCRKIVSDYCLREWLQFLRTKASYILYA